MPTSKVDYWQEKAFEVWAEACGLREKAKARLAAAADYAQLAADALPSAEGHEPQRSMLYACAAEWARLVGAAKEALRLAERGLEGAPPDEMRAQLLEIIERVKRNGTA